MQVVIEPGSEQLMVCWWGVGGSREAERPLYCLQNGCMHSYDVSAVFRLNFTVVCFLFK